MKESKDNELKYFTGDLIPEENEELNEKKNEEETEKVEYICE